MVAETLQEPEEMTITDQQPEEHDFDIVDDYEYMNQVSQATPQTSVRHRSENNNSDLEYLSPEPESVADSIDFHP